MEEEKKVDPQPIPPIAALPSSSNSSTESIPPAVLNRLQTTPPTSSAHHVQTVPNFQPAGVPAQPPLLPQITDPATANAVLAALLQTNPALLQQLLAQQQQQQAQQAAAALLMQLPAASLTHNLIPQHLQAYSLACSLNGTPGYSPALIPPLLAASVPPQAPVPQFVPPPVPIPVASPVTVFQSMTLQDRLVLDPSFVPQYNGINPNYPGVRVLSSDPPVFAVDKFLTPMECQFLVTVASDAFGPAPVVGKGVGEVSASRTSSTCYLAREDLPDYMRKVAALTGKPVEHCELPQVGRYFPSQQYLQHFDAFDTNTEDGRRFASNGGQRTITVLVYLNDVMRGGATRFPALNLDVQPCQGTALVFFPSTIDGFLDKRALHAALPAIDTKFVSQVWIRQTNYNGQPSKRLTQIMGAPLPPLGQHAAPVAPVAPSKQAPASETTANKSAANRIPNPLAPGSLPTTF